MIVAISNQKGGVGKTTSALCLAALLAEKAPTLAVDLDPQGNLTTCLGVEVSSEHVISYDVLVGKSTLEETVVEIEKGFDLLPTNLTLAKAERDLAGEFGAHSILKEKLEDVADRYKHIVIDCPPSLSLLTFSALCAADSVLVPVQCQFLALQAVQQLFETIESVRKRANPVLTILGVLPTMADRTLMSKDVISVLEEDLEGVEIFRPVPKSVKFAEMTVAKQPIHKYAPDSRELIQPYRDIAIKIGQEG